MILIANKWNEDATSVADISHMDRTIYSVLSFSLYGKPRVRFVVADPEINNFIFKLEGERTLAIDAMVKQDIHIREASLWKRLRYLVTRRL